MIGKLLRAFLAILLIGIGIFLPFATNYVTLPYMGDRLTLPTYYVGVGQLILFLASILLYKKLPSVGIWLVYVVLMFLLSSFMILSSMSLLPILSPYDVNLFSMNKETLTYNIIGLVGSSVIPPAVIYLLLGSSSESVPRKSVKKEVVKEEEAPPSPQLSQRELMEKTMAYKSAEIDQALSKMGEFPSAEMRGPAPRALDLDQELRITKGRAKSPLFTEDLEKSLSDIFGESPVIPQPRRPEAPPTGFSSFEKSSPLSPSFSMPSAPSVSAEKRAEEIVKAAAASPKTVEQRPEGLKPLGKMLVDQETVSKIITGAEKKPGLTSTRIISAAKGRTLDLLLEDINKYPGVQGSVIVGKDGLVIGSTLPEEGEKELIGAVASSVYSNVDISCARMNRGGLKQAILETEKGLIIISEIDVGIFIVLAGPEARNTLGELIKTIKSTLDVAKSLSKVG